MSDTNRPIRIYLNTNQKWGWVNSFQELLDFAQHIIDNGGWSDHLNELIAILGGCRRAPLANDEFGLYSEHNGAMLAHEGWWKSFLAFVAEQDIPTEDEDETDEGEPQSMKKYEIVPATYSAVIKFPLEDGRILSFEYEGCPGDRIWEVKASAKRVADEFRYLSFLSCK